MCDILNSKLITAPPHNLEDLVNCYNSTLTAILDKHAPVKSKKVLPVLTLGTHQHLKLSKQLVASLNANGYLVNLLQTFCFSVQPQMLTINPSLLPKSFTMPT